MLIHRWVDRIGVEGTGVMEEEEGDVWYVTDYGEEMGHGEEMGLVVEGEDQEVWVEEPWFCDWQIRIEPSK